MSDKLPEVIYYQDELNDEFSFEKIETPFIGEDYDYLHDTFFGRLAHFFIYHIIARPLAFFYLKFSFHHKIVGREKLKGYKSYFLYGNHTQIIADALIPAFITQPRDVKIIVHPNNIKAPIVGKYVPYLGGYPLPSDMKATRNFIKAIDKTVKENHPIVIYPEAHLWPYYIGIRPFKETSFRYPIKYDVPTFCFTNTYHKRKGKNKCQIITYIDGPFFIDKDKGNEENKMMLRNLCYESMKKRAETSDIEIIRYLKKND